MDDRGGPRGRGTARGRGSGRGRGGRGATRGAQAPPLAVQMRQLDRLNEPDEVGIMRRLRGVALRVRSTYGANGLLEREIGVSQEDATTLGRGAGHAGINWVSLVDAEDLLLRRSTDELRVRREGRRAARLPADRQQVAVNELTAEELRLLDLSQQAWDRFRAPGGANPEGA